MPGLSDFYTGAMAPPDRGPNGTLVQSRTYPAPASIPELYRGMYSEVGGAPTKRTVQTVPVGPSYADKNRNDVIESKPAPVVTAQRSSTVNAAQPLDVSRLGLTSSPFDTSATRAIATATKSGYSDLGPGLQLGYGSILDMLYDPAYSNVGRSTKPIASPGPGTIVDDPWGNMRVAPAGPARPGLATGTPAGRGEASAPVAEASPSIASLFGGYVPQVGFNGSTTVTSNELAGGNGSIFSQNTVLPPSMNTSRWLTGY